MEKYEVVKYLGVGIFGMAKLMRNEEKSKFTSLA